jgi:hypothetical protein
LFCYFFFERRRDGAFDEFVENIEFCLGEGAVVSVVGGEETPMVGEPLFAEVVCH